jgi:hypothetical protein
MKSVSKMSRSPVDEWIEKSVVQAIYSGQRESF